MSWSDVNWTAVGLAATAIATLLTAAATLLKARNDRRAGISSDEREARRDQAEDRRDTIADRDELIKTFLGEVRDLRGRVEIAERGLRVRDDHIDVLEHHIWQGKPPPPPTRPDGI